MQASHLDQVLQIERVSFPTPWSRQAFLSELYHNDFAHYYVYLLDGLVVGYAGMWVILDEAHVTNVAVHPQYRGKQVGEKLLHHLLGEAAARGAGRITLEVRPSNQPAQHLYQKLGFKPVGVRKGYYTDTHEDAIIMWRRLDRLGGRGRTGRRENPAASSNGRE
jgi:ribosomal-protein-alanine N-acetyltransferase